MAGLGCVRSVQIIMVRDVCFRSLGFGRTGFGQARSTTISWPLLGIIIARPEASGCMYWALGFLVLHGILLPGTFASRCRDEGGGVFRCRNRGFEVMLPSCNAGLAQVSCAFASRSVRVTAVSPCVGIPSASSPVDLACGPRRNLQP